MGMLPAQATLESITASASFGHRFYTGIEMLNRLLVVELVHVLILSL